MMEMHRVTGSHTNAASVSPLADALRERVARKATDVLPDDVFWFF
jgi:hypothetical protein